MPINTRQLAVSALLALLAGCASQPAPQATQDTTKFTVENTVRFAALDPETEATISCTGLRERALGDGRLEVVANLRNGAARASRVWVQCVFLDDQGLPLAGEAPRQGVRIAAGATEVVRFTAPALSARKYSIRVRMAR
ncbi:MAG TPA: hypothetical protein VGG34_14385 [Opitutaceae bacterium]|jgi:uncharacterized protein YcfL